MSRCGTPVHDEKISMSSAEMSTVLVVPVEYAQKIRAELEKLKLWDGAHKLKKLADSDEVAVPIIPNGKNISVIAEKWPDFKVTQTDMPLSKKVKVKQNSPAVRLQAEVRHLLTLYRLSEDLLNEVPSKWERHDDLVIIPAYTFSSPKWATIGEELWHVVAKCLACKRLARHSAIANNGFRSSRVVILLGENGEVTHVDNGIRYAYDVTKCMFSPGNITEKIRIANLDCSNETVVDLYAGIGYFTLPYLVHARAGHVHACEWNPAAVAALKRNLLLNGVSERCTIHEGDNRMLRLQSLADRVNLGLIPSSEEGWPVAVQVLKLTGGTLHVHGNVTVFHKKNTLKDHLFDEFRMNDTKCSLSEKNHWLSCQQVGQGNALIVDKDKGDHSSFRLKRSNLNVAVLDQDNEDDINEGKVRLLRSLKEFKTRPDTSESSLPPSTSVDSESTFECAFTENSILSDVSIEPSDCRQYLADNSLQNSGEKWQQTSVNSQLCCKLSCDSRKTIPSKDGEKECFVTSGDSCQVTMQTCTNCIIDNELTSSQNRAGNNVHLACESWSLYVQRKMKYLLETKKGGVWVVTPVHLEIVKSYAPHIVHAVLDLDCRPV